MTEFVLIVVVVVLAIAIIVGVLRWALRINTLVERQEEQIRLLREIAMNVKDNSRFNNESEI